MSAVKPVDEARERLSNAHANGQHGDPRDLALVLDDLLTRASARTAPTKAEPVMKAVKATRGRAKAAPATPPAE